jgi:hypothetical protein
MEACSTVRDPAADAPYLKNSEKRVSHTLNRNKNAPKERTVRPSRKNNTRRNNMASAATEQPKPKTKGSNYRIIDGDILNMPTGDGNYIVQQCCCTCTKPAGLSEAIAKKWGTDEFQKLNPALNPYAGRKPVGRTRTATVETRDKIASARLLHDEENDVNVICLFAQYGPGKPSAYEDDYVTADDTAAARLRYFSKALAKMTAIVPAGSTLYVPYGIGSGLAGGKWADYEAALREFARAHPEYKMVVVHKK